MEYDTRNHFLGICSMCITIPVMLYIPKHCIVYTVYVLCQIWLVAITNAFQSSYILWLSSINKIQRWYELLCAVRDSVLFVNRSFECDSLYAHIFTLVRRLDMTAHSHIIWQGNNCNTELKESALDKEESFVLILFSAEAELFSNKQLYTSVSHQMAFCFTEYMISKPKCIFI